EPSLATNALPKRSVMADDSCVTTTVSVGHGSVGVNRTVVLPLRKLNAPGTGVPAPIVTLNDCGVMLAGSMISVNVTEVGAASEMPTALLAGSMACTFGGVVAGACVVKMKLRGTANWLPA